MYNNNHENYLDSGFYDFTNSLDSYGIWHLVSPKEYKNATLVLRYAHGKTDTRRMMVKMNDDVLGAITFTPTADWDSWDSSMVKVNLKSGLNILYLKSLEEGGGPNLDQIEFDVEGVILFEDSTQLSNIDDENAVENLIENPPDDSDDATGFSAEDDFYSNVKISGNIYLNFVDGTLIARESSHVHVKIFDLTGHSVWEFAGHVPAGASDLSDSFRKLPQGSYLVQVNVDGKMKQGGVKVNLQK